MEASLRADFSAVVAAYEAMATREDHHDRLRRMSHIERLLGESCGEEDTAAALGLIDA
jgi:hypothetical protein